MKSVLAFSFFFATFFCGQNVKAQNTTIARANIDIDAYINKTMAETGIVGAAAAIIIDKKLVWTKGYGYADRENKRPFTANTIMNIASISKVFYWCLLNEGC